MLTLSSNMNFSDLLIHITHLLLSQPKGPEAMSSWLQIQRSGIDWRHYQIFWEVVGLERGPFSLVSTTEEILGRKNSGSGLESREYGRSDPSRWPRGTLYSQTLALASPTSGGRSIGIVCSRTQATECFIIHYRTEVQRVRTQEKQNTQTDMWPTSKHSFSRWSGLFFREGGGVECNRVHYYWDHCWPIGPASDDDGWWAWSNRWNYKYNNFTRNLVGRSFGRCLRNRLLSGSSMRFTVRSFGCELRRALYWELKRRISSLLLWNPKVCYRV
jgi:hypothetical protein